jgi:hypothetical protein
MENIMFVKQLVRVQSNILFNMYDFDGSLDKMIDYLQQIKADVVARYPDAVDVIVEHYYGYEGVEYSTVFYDRWETDGEMEARIEKEARAAEKRRIAKEKREAAKATKVSAEEKRERATYEKLKKKYG